MSVDILPDLTAALAWWADVSDGAPTSALIGGGAVSRLERRFAGITGHATAAAVGSGTSALCAALLAAGVGAGDRVLMAAYDWPAATAAARLVGARPVYVDVDDVGTLDVTEVAAAFARTGAKAVVATHLSGQLAEVPGIVEIAHDVGALVIEDCAQALGAELRGVPAGGMADLACFSLGPGKLVDAGEGGVVAATRPDLVEAIHRSVHHPLRQRLVGLDDPTPWAAIGRIHPGAAVLACYRLDDWPDRLARRRAAVGRQLDFLARAELVAPSPVRPASRPSWHHITAIVRADACVEDALAELEEIRLDAGPGPLAHPAGLADGLLPPRSRERHGRSIVIEPGGAK